MATPWRRTTARRGAGTLARRLSAGPRARHVGEEGRRVTLPGANSALRGEILRFGRRGWRPRREKRSSTRRLRARRRSGVDQRQKRRPPEIRSPSVRRSSRRRTGCRLRHPGRRSNSLHPGWAAPARRVCAGRSHRPSKTHPRSGGPGLAEGGGRRPVRSTKLSPSLGWVSRQTNNHELPRRWRKARIGAPRFEQSSQSPLRVAKLESCRTLGVFLLSTQVHAVHLVAAKLMPLDRLTQFAILKPDYSDWQASERDRNNYDRQHQRCRTNSRQPAQVPGNIRNESVSTW